MKKIALLSITLFVHNVSVFGQSGQKYGTTGNALSQGDVIGSTNNIPLTFITNSQHQAVLGTNGIFQLNSLSGAGNRLLQTDANGSLIPLVMGATNQYLNGNGSWINFPVMPWIFTRNGSINYNGTVGINNSNPNPSYALDVNGDAHFANNLHVDGGILIGTQAKLDQVNSYTVSATNITGDVLTANTAISAPSVEAGSISLPRGSAALTVNGSGNFNGGLSITQGLAINSLAGNGMQPVFVDGAGNLRSAISFSPACGSAYPWNIGGNVIGAYTTELPAWDIGTCDANDFILKANSSQAIWVKPSGNIGIGTSSPTSKLGVSGVYNPGNGSGSGLTVKMTSMVPWSYNSLFSVDNDMAKAIAVQNSASNTENFVVFGDGRTVINNTSTTVLPVFRIVNPNYPYPNWANDVFRIYNDGKVWSTEVNVALASNFPDYVFSENYNRMSLEKLESYLKNSKHLPGMPSAKEVEKDGMALGEMERIHVEKTEELYLYVIELNKKLEALSQKNTQLEKEISKLRSSNK